MSQAKRIAAALLLVVVGLPVFGRAQVPPQFSGTIAVPLVPSPPAMTDTLTSSAWAQAAHVELRYNLRTHAEASEQTTADVLTDGASLYVRFTAAQREPVRAAQHTNDVGEGTDDQVAVYLWPDGAQGYNYGFISNPVGTHYQSSSENTSYAPSWESLGKITATGYVVVMKIPLAVIRGGTTGQPWRLEFARTISSTLDDFVWSYGSAQLALDDHNIVYAGSMTGMPVRQAVTKPQPRVGLYGLAAASSTPGNTFTSRAGADISVPIGTSSSVLATLHPDYSNVELDQQTIQPTAFRRFFNEVRPFFTQGASFYNNAPCINCPVQELYTPAIPTPRDGYAVEGKEGPLSFGAFDAIGYGRSDAAEALDITTLDQKNRFSAQHVGVSIPPFDDRNTVVSLGHDSLKGLSEYVDYGSDNGTLVTDPSQARREEAGMTYYDKTSNIDAVLRHIGSEYDPVDGFVQNTDIAGYSLDAEKTWYYDPKATIPRSIFFADVDRYRNRFGEPDQSDNQVALGFDFQNIRFAPELWHLRAQSGSSYLLLPNGVYTPVSLNDIDLSYDYRSADQSTVTYATGRFGPGRLDSWTRSFGLRAGTRGTLNIELDNTVQAVDGGATNTQWLERVGYSYQFSSDSSLAVGLRKIIGTPLQLAPGFNFTEPPASNVSLAYYKRVGRDELYLVYGDPSALVTAPQVILKFVHYFGAEKGT